MRATINHSVRKTISSEAWVLIQKKKKIGDKNCFIKIWKSELENFNFRFLSPLYAMAYNVFYLSTVYDVGCILPCEF